MYSGRPYSFIKDPKLRGYNPKSSLEYICNKESKEFESFGFTKNDFKISKTGLRSNIKRNEQRYTHVAEESILSNDIPKFYVIP